jgi:2-methylcitrate dehydratase PrpD
MATIAETLAARVVATTFGDISAAALHYARIGVLDTVAVGVAGAADEATLIARNVVESKDGPALLWGTQQRRSAGDAAFINGIASNVLDYDDCTDNLGGHPSSPILPALVALAEERGASGRDLLTAYVAGFEVETALGRGVNFHHYEKGWHPTSTLGVFGAAAACARLMGLDERATTRALALSASLACGIKSNLGSMGKPMHIGQCSRNGLLAARLAAAGYTGNADALEHHQGFLEVFNGAGHYDAARIVEKWGAPWDIEMPGIAIKQYPCCLSTQGVVDAMLRLVREHDIDPEQVVRVDARLSARRLEHTNRPAPRSALDAKLSVQYVLARALADREVGLAHFQGETYRDENIRRTMERVHAVPLDAQTLAREGDMHADVTVTLRSGVAHRGSIGRPVGHEPGVPLDSGLHKAKFEACTRGSLTRQQADALYAAVQSLESLDDIRTLTAALAGAATREVNPA